MNRVATTVASACAALLAAAASPCAAQSDGAYGRLDGDLAWQVDVGAGLRDRSPGSVFSLSTRYLETAGLYASEFEPWTAHRDHPRTASIGVELRPLFLPRFLKNMERGPSWLDLTIDSSSLRLGPFISSSSLASLRTPGWETSLQLGVPFTSRAAGPWLRLGATVQWPDTGLPHRPAHAPSALWTVAVAWQGLVDAGLVDLGDRSPP